MLEKWLHCLMRSTRTKHREMEMKAGNGCSDFKLVVHRDFSIGTSVCLVTNLSTRKVLMMGCEVRTQGRREERVNRTVDAIRDQNMNLLADEPRTRNEDRTASLSDDVLDRDCGYIATYELVRLPGQVKVEDARCATGIEGGILPDLCLELAGEAGETVERGGRLRLRHDGQDTDCEAGRTV